MASPHTKTGRITNSRIDFNQIWGMIKAAATSWSDDYAPSMGAALSYYTLFSIAPLLLIVISVAGLVFGEEAARGEIFSQLNGFMGSEAAAAIQGLLESVNKPTKGTLATVVGIVLVIIGATTVFAELQDALDRIWRAPARHQSKGIWGLLRTRLLSFGMILSIGFLLMVSLVMGAVLSAFNRWWSPFFAGWETVAQGFNVVFSFVITLLAFAMIYKIMPRVKIAWRDVWIGAAVTAFLFTAGKFLIGLYIGRSGVVSGFGAASSIVIVLIWVYYSAQIFLVGAEFTWVYAHMFGSRKGQKTPKASEAPTVRNEKELSAVPVNTQSVSAERKG
ncbi:MAG: YihY/virulence factor BrkB family protein [Thiobacillus sp.]